MKSKFPAILSLLLCLTGSAGAMEPKLGEFLFSKQQQLRNLSETITNKIPNLVWRFYDAARLENWENTSNLFHQISIASHRYTIATNDAPMTPALATLIWPPLSESYGACEQFQEWDKRWLHRFGDDIIRSIPPGSIYFGGTDPGRFVISVLVETQVEGKPFFILTQNQLADGAYTDYLRAMYGKKIKIPTVEDIQEIFQEYAEDFARKNPQQAAKLHGKDGRIQISGQVQVMEISGLIVKKIFNDNPDREVFIEESYPLEWMYPHLTPHGTIFKLNRKSLATIPEPELEANQKLWKQLSDEMLGSWLDDKTSIEQVCMFAAKFGAGENLEDYAGDKNFAANEQARKCFSKLRSSQAGMYFWRLQHAANSEEAKRMKGAADYAFRQSFAICPNSPEAVYRYVNLLLVDGRLDDAILIASTADRVRPKNDQFKNLLNQLKAYRDQSGIKPEKKQPERKL